MCRYWDEKEERESQAQQARLDVSNPEYFRIRVVYSKPTLKSEYN
jgi:hypothetical protein